MVKVVPDGREFIVWDDQAGKELGRYNTQSQASYNANLLQYQQNNTRDDQAQAQRAQKWGEANNPAPAQQAPTQQRQVGPTADQWRQGPNALQNDFDKNAWDQYKRERGIGTHGMDDPFAGYDPTKDLFKTSYGNDQEKQAVWQNFTNWYQEQQAQNPMWYQNQGAVQKPGGVLPNYQYGKQVQQGYSTGVFSYKDWLEKRRNGWI